MELETGSWWAPMPARSQLTYPCGRIFWLLDWVLGHLPARHRSGSWMQSEAANSASVRGSGRADILIGISDALTIRFTIPAPLACRL